jgi:ribonuclease P protein component
VRQSGKKFTHPLVVIVIAKDNEGQKRVGIVTNKTIGNAVTRNLIKRRLRAITGQLIQKVNKDVDILLFAREPIRDATYEAIWQAIMDVFLKAEIILE